MDGPVTHVPRRWVQTGRIRLLASVRDADEALAAAGAGADIIDFKEPRRGALGAVPLVRLAAAIKALRSMYPTLTISATIGDVQAPALIAAAIDRTKAAGVDYVKVGITKGPKGRTQLRELARYGPTCVPVLMADGGIDLDLARAAAAIGCDFVIVDTVDKKTGGLFDCCERAAMAEFVDIVRAAGCAVGLAGSLRLADAGRLRELKPDLAGFRGALCDGERTGKLVAGHVTQARVALGVVEGLRDIAV